MRTFQNIIERAKLLGYPIAEYEFKITKNNPAPKPPFVVWLSDEKARGADNKNNIFEINGFIELYTDRSTDKEIEKRIEKNVLFDVEYEKKQTMIPNENMVQTSYSFQIIEKRSE